MVLFCQEVKDASIHKEQQGSSSFLLHQFLKTHHSKQLNREANPTFRGEIQIPKRIFKGHFRLKRCLTVSL